MQQQALQALAPLMAAPAVAGPSRAGVHQSRNKNRNKKGRVVKGKRVVRVPPEERRRQYAMNSRMRYKGQTYYGKVGPNRKYTRVAMVKQYIRRMPGRGHWPQGRQKADGGGGGYRIRSDRPGRTPAHLKWLTSQYKQGNFPPN